MQNDVVSESFENLPLEQGIGRLLAGRSFAIFHGSPTAQSGRSGDLAPTQLWVLPKPEQAPPAASVAAAPETWSRPVFLEDADPGARLAALDDFAERRDPLAVDALAQAMADADEAVRAKAQALFDRALLQPGAASAQAPRTRK
jgi:hypothetical protein